MCAAIGAGALFYAWQVSPNVYLMGYEKEDLPQYRFARIIAQEEDKTLLNYGFLDGGFYFAADVAPPVKYFCELNIRQPKMYIEQALYVRRAEVEFVVIRGDQYRAAMEDTPAYRCVAQAELFYEGKVRTYYLYQRV